MSLSFPFLVSVSCSTFLNCLNFVRCSVIITFLQEKLAKIVFPEEKMEFNFLAIKNLRISIPIKFQFFYFYPIGWKNAPGLWVIRGHNQMIKNYLTFQQNLPCGCQSNNRSNRFLLRHHFHIHWHCLHSHSPAPKVEKEYSHGLLITSTS